MFGPLGVPEVLIILGIALVIFGPRRLPEMGRTLGRALGEFRRATTDLKRSVQFEMDAEDDRQRRDTEAEERRKQEAKALPTGTIAASEPATDLAPEPATEPVTQDSAEAAAAPSDAADEAADEGSAQASSDVPAAESSKSNDG